MKSAQLFSILLSYLFIFIGLGIVAEVTLLKQYTTLVTPFRVFFWGLNILTFGHLVLLIPYQKMIDEGKKSRWIFFITINHFIVSLLVILIYGIWLFDGNRLDGILAVIMYSIIFVLFITIVMKVAKK